MRFAFNALNPTVAGCAVVQGYSTHGDVSELADEHDLGSCAERREGSIPSVPILSNLSLGAVGEANFSHRNDRNRIEGIYEIENRKDD